MKDFAMEILSRIQSESPLFFKKLRKAAVVLTAIFLAVTYLPEMISYLGITVDIPAKVFVVSEKLYQAFVMLFGFSFLTKKDSNPIQ